MLSVFLACDDPYATGRLMTGVLGWTPVFATPADDDDKLVIVSLAGARVMLSTAEERWLPAAARDYRGAGVTVFVALPPEADIDAIHARHAAGGVITTPLADRPFGQRAFDAVIAGYRFMISQEPGPPAS